MVKQIGYFFRYPVAVALLLSAAGLASGAEAYYLMDDGSRWVSEDGTPITGIRKSSLLICKQDAPCLDLMNAGRELNLWRQRGTMWQQINSARQRLEESENDRVDLDTATGRALYNSAERGSRQTLR